MDLFNPQNKINQQVNQPHQAKPDRVNKTTSDPGPEAQSTGFPPDPQDGMVKRFAKRQINKRMQKRQSETKGLKQDGTLPEAGTPGESPTTGPISAQTPKAQTPTPQYRAPKPPRPSVPKAAMPRFRRPGL